MRFETIGVEQGLSQGLVTSIAIDSLGFLWAATPSGLNRYDGERVKVFRHDENDSTSLPVNHVYQLLVDSRGWLWVSAFKNGLSLYRPETESFINFRSVSFSIEHFGSSGYTSLTEDSEGNIWCRQTDSTYVILNIPSTTKEIPENPKWNLIKGADYYKGLPEFTSWFSMLFLPENRLWYLHNDSLYNYKLDTINKRARFISRISVPTYKGQDSAILSSNRHMLVYDKKRDAIYFRSDRGIEVIDPNSNVLVDHINLPEDYPETHSIFLSPNNEIYGTTIFYGILKVDVSTGKSQWYDISLNEVIRNEFLHRFIWDEYGNLWSGSAGFGMCKRQVNQSRFNTFPEEPGSVMYTSMLTEDNKGRIYFQDNRFRFFDRNTKSLKTSWIDTLRIWKLSKFMNHFKIQGKSGKIWMQIRARSFDDTQLYSFNPESDSFKLEFENDSILRFLFRWAYDTSGNIWYFHNDRQDNRGLVMLDENNPPSSKKTHLKPSDFIKRMDPKCMDIGPDNSAWIGSQIGLLRIHSNGQAEEITFGKSIYEFNSENRIKCLKVDRIQGDSIIWLGKDGVGLVRYNYLLHKSETLNTSKGLSNNVIYQILQDSIGIIWVSTNKGLSYYDRNNQKIRNFYKEDGLQDSEFNTGSGLLSSSGEMFFGGVSGFNYFYPQSFYFDTIPSEVRFTGIRLLNLPVPIKKNKKTAKSFQLAKAAPFADDLTFPNDQSIITFEYSLMDFSTPQENTFKYKLDGFKDQWIENGTNNEVTFTGLPPGNYTLNVKGKNHAGNWSTQPAILNFTIDPAWYQTWFFRLALLITSGLLLYAFFQFRLKQKLKLESMRDRIARDLHDELGSTLSSISLYSTVAKRQLIEAPKATQDLLSKISDNTTSVMEAMNDMVWAVKVDNDKLEELINRMRNFAVELSEYSKTELHFNADKRLSNLKSDMVLRRNIYLVFKEASNNAIKYAGCKNLWVNLELHGKHIVLLVKDDGVGFNPNDLNNELSMGGNGLGNMKKRAEELNGELIIESEINNGCLIQLIAKIDA